MNQFLRKFGSSASDPRQVSELGPLEVEVMEQVWCQGTCNVRDVAEQLPRKLAYTTVMTTLDRLYKKGVLTRDPSGRAFVYKARFSRGEWERQRANVLLQGFLAGSQETHHMLLSSLVDAVGSHDAELLDELERKIQEKRKELSGSRK